MKELKMEYDEHGELVVRKYIDGELVSERNPTGIEARWYYHHCTLKDE